MNEKREEERLKKRTEVEEVSGEITRLTREIVEAMNGQRVLLPFKKKADKKDDT
jgi:hypothetical protein